MTVIGIDIGGRTVRAARIGTDGTVLARTTAPTPTDGEPRGVGEVVRSTVERIGGGAGPRIIGLSVPGRFGTDRRTMQVAVNLPLLNGIDVHALISNAVGADVAIFSDVSAAGYGQWWSAATPDRGGTVGRFVYLGLGTGVGGVAIIDGAVVDGASGGPAQYGHLIVDTSADAAVCRCGARGCLEAIVGGPALDRTGVTEAVVGALAIGLQQLSHLWAPDEIALGGGVIEHHPELVARAGLWLRERQGSLTPGHLRITRAALASDDAGVIGAGLLALAARGSPGSASRGARSGGGL